ncbi:MAG: hypothetical protein C5B50_03035 [Verrucomicrobia bacterium]|nr:MAG: hypothetical protein C5B50_03035 [Verrucomicrobiota bacterium]
MTRHSNPQQSTAVPQAQYPTPLQCNFVANFVVNFVDPRPQLRRKNAANELQLNRKSATGFAPVCAGLHPFAAICAQKIRQNFLTCRSHPKTIRRNLNPETSLTPIPSFHASTIPTFQHSRS